MRRFTIPAALLALIAASSPAAAQMGGLNFGAAYGPSRIVGGHSDSFNTGWHAEALSDLSLPLVPIGFRAELAYDHIGNKAGSAATEALTLGSALINATVALPLPMVHPYVIGGIGYYSRNGALGGGREGKGGINGGAGVELKLTTLHLFAEARYHSIGFIGSSVHLLPITIGVVF